MWKPNVKKFLEAKFAKWAWGLGFLSFASLLRFREPIFEKLHQKRLLMHSCSDSDAKSFFCFFPPLAANTVKKDLNLSKYICAWLKWTFYLNKCKRLLPFSHKNPSFFHKHKKISYISILFLTVWNNSLFGWQLRGNDQLATCMIHFDDLLLLLIILLFSTRCINIFFYSSFCYCSAQLS